MKRIIILIIILLSLTGCNSYTELNDLSIVNSLGIDYIDEAYNLTLSIIEGTNNENNIKIFKSQKESLKEAIEDIYLNSNKKLYLSHIDLLILTPNSINEKLDEILDSFLKNNEYRNNFQTVLMSSSDLDNFFDKKLSAKEITDLIDTNSLETSITTKKELETFLKEILIDNNSYLPTITFNNDTLTLIGYTLIKDKKIYESLTNQESVLLNILNNDANRGYIDNITIYKSDIRVTTKKNKITFELYLETDTNDDNKIDNLKNKFYELLKKYQDDDYDILKLDELVRKNNYSYYKKNNNLLKQLEFKIKINNKMQDNYINGGLYEK